MLKMSRPETSIELDQVTAESPLVLAVYLFASLHLQSFNVAIESFLLTCFPSALRQRDCFDEGMEMQTIKAGLYLPICD